MLVDTCQNTQNFSYIGSPHYKIFFQNHFLVYSSSRMRVIYHNWSATKQRPHPQSVAEISRHSVLAGHDSTM